MEVAIDKIYELQAFYEKCLTHADVRIKDWLLMDSCLPTVFFTCLYLVVVWVGPKVMEHREPFNLKWFINAYNFVLILVNLHICTQLLVWTTHQGYSYICQPVRYTHEEGEMKIASALWWFYFSKLLEMLDTIIFILRKKNNQVSFLHVYHHATMFPIWWIGVKWVAGGQSFFGAMINSFIHVIMYSYYGLAALGPQFQKYLWWKRYLTKLQLIQFMAGIIHAAQSLVFGCDFPAWMHWALIIYAATILLLFLNFYFHAYIKAQQKKNKKMTNGACVQNGVVHEVKKDK
ncbi:elongation of very long chain fatty acids protein 4-like isoform X2 [Gigantopelta aegis]|uniref:elongation of very long chain fatty acids protein 4-like isoform X2 n=1 Tax=Gigantopelta aegis TaxID=1735272 RepID=UPI001B88B2E0|nr:elongation of very long chain fatty acids protein 4-like isoform X2 [Gigantopelta aegis]